MTPTWSNEMLTIEHDDDGGCFRLLDDGIGMCTSKSRSVLVRVRDALNAIRATGLVGLTVKHQKDTIPNRVDGYPRGVVLALVSGPPQLVVRRADDKLDVWPVLDCVVVEPERPEKETPSNEPGLGVHAAVALLLRWLEASSLESPERTAKVRKETEQFLKARKRAEPVP
jgi:hypothetical protein